MTSPWRSAPGVPSRHGTAILAATRRVLRLAGFSESGLVIMGMDYALISIEKTFDGFVISQNECIGADKGNPETINEAISAKKSDIYFRINVNPDAMCYFSYSLDGKKFTKTGKPFKAREGKWIGAKVGVFCTRPIRNNDGGRMEMDWFRVTPNP